MRCMMMMLAVFHSENAHIGLDLNITWRGKAYHRLLGEYNHEMCGWLNCDGPRCSRQCSRCTTVFLV